MIASFRTDNTPIWGEYQSAIITLYKVLREYTSQSDAPWGSPQKEIEYEGYIIFEREINIAGRKFRQPILKKVLVNDRALGQPYAYEIEGKAIDLLRIAKDHAIKIEAGVVEKKIIRPSNLD